MSLCNPIQLIEWNVLVPVFAVLGSVLISWFIFKFIKANKGIKGSKVNYFCSLFFAVFIVITLILWCISSSIICFDSNLRLTIWKMVDAAYAIQYIALFFLLFNRVCIVFDGTTYAVPQRTQIMYYAYYVFLGLFSVIGGAIFYGTKTGMFLQIIVTLLTLLLIVYLIQLFTSKLLKVYKDVEINMESNIDAKMVGVATKSFLLSMSSILSMFMIMILAVIRFQTALAESKHFTFVFNIAFFMDLLTNFMSIFLGLKRFIFGYEKVCGVCHVKLVMCCTRRIDKKEKVKVFEGKTMASYDQKIVAVDSCVGTSS